jgi:hypothetical protein
MGTTSLTTVTSTINSITLCGIMQTTVLPVQIFNFYRIPTYGMHSPVVHCPAMEATPDRKAIRPLTMDNAPSPITLGPALETGRKTMGNLRTPPGPILKLQREAMTGGKTISGQKTMPPTMKSEQAGSVCCTEYRITKDTSSINRYLGIAIFH